MFCDLVGSTVLAGELDPDLPPATGRARPDEIDTLLVESLEIAREQKARSWELRTACDLACLRQRQGRWEEAVSLLQRSYDQFSEGLETADVMYAKTLLDQLYCSTTTQGSEKVIEAEEGSSP
jgi:hypothetical protein